MAMGIVEVGPGYGVDGADLGIVEVQPGYALQGYGVELMGPTYESVQLVGAGGVQLVGSGFGMTEDTKKYLTWAGIFAGGLAVGIGASMLLR